MSSSHDTGLASMLATLSHAGEHEVYVLRVWYERDGDTAVWRASVKPPYDEPRRHFTRPEALLAYLSARLEPEPPDTS